MQVHTGVRILPLSHTTHLIDVPPGSSQHSRQRCSHPSKEGFENIFFVRQFEKTGTEVRYYSVATSPLLRLKMSQIKYRHPLLEWDEYNQDPDLAFTLVALNERARQMWAKPHNSSRYVPPSFTRATSIKEDEELEIEDKQTRPKEEKDREPALQFLFSKQPKDFAKGFVLGSDGMICDALLGDPGSRVSPQALAFTFNKKHQLVMHATSANIVAVTFNDQKKAERTQFSWILPRGQREIRVEMAHKLQFEVVFPRYGTRKHEFHQNCNKYISYVARGEVPTHGLDNNSEAVTRPESGTSKSWDPSSFYLRGRKIGSGTYGDVETVLRMPDGKIFAAKRFKSRKSFRKEVRMLQKVCETLHVSTNQCLADCTTAD